MIASTGTVKATHLFLCLFLYLRCFRDVYFFIAFNLPRQIIGSYTWPRSGIVYGYCAAISSDLLLAHILLDWGFLKVQQHSHLFRPASCRCFGARAYLPPVVATHIDWEISDLRILLTLIPPNLCSNTPLGGSH